MKHPVRDRLLMLLYALASLCVAVVLIAMVFGMISPEMIGSFAEKIKAFPVKAMKLAMTVLAAVLTVLGVSLICAIFPPRKRRSSNFALQKNENGTVRISLKTIDALVQKCLGQHSELKIVSSSLFSDEETVRVDVHIVLLADISMPLAISALQRQITKYVEACSGVNVCEVRVFVDGAMTAAEKAAQSPYALPASVLIEETPVEETQEEPQETVSAQENAQEEATAEEPSVKEEATEAEEEPAPAFEPAKETACEQEETAKEESTEEEVPVQEPIPEKKKLFGHFSK